MGHGSRCPCGQTTIRSVDRDLHRRVEASGYEAPGFADRYDEVRPRPPHVLRTLIPPLVDRPIRHVVDLGSGTGLSARLWADLATEVIGVEPSASMRARAARSTPQANVRYVDGSGETTGLEAGSADLVTASQSLHWMDPGPTLHEVGRILRPGGLLCAYEYFSIQTPSWALEAAYLQVREAVRRVRSERGLPHPVVQWQINADRIEASGAFEFVRETAVHSVEEGRGSRLLDIALSEGSLTTLLSAGITEEAVGLPLLREAAAAVVEPVPWWIGYHVWLGRRPS